MGLDFFFKCGVFVCFTHFYMHFFSIYSMIKYKLHFLFKRTKEPMNQSWSLLSTFRQSCFCGLFISDYCSSINLFIKCIILHIYAWWRKCFSKTNSILTAIIHANKYLIGNIMYNFHTVIKAAIPLTHSLC